MHVEILPRRAWNLVAASARWVRDRVVDRIWDWAFELACDREPDVVIGGAKDPYLKRWWVIPRNRWFNIYIHKFMPSDDDRALHDHPWINVSLVLYGGYIEHSIAAGGVHSETARNAGDVVARLASTAHRIELREWKECWTLFLTGPAMRSWGFHCPRGWVHWRDFTNPADGGATVGRGCGEMDLGESDAEPGR